MPDMPEVEGKCARGASFFEDVPLVEFTDLVFTWELPSVTLVLGVEFT